MLTLPFPLEPLPADQAEAGLAQLRRRTNTQPVLLGDADIFSAEWAEIVDAFEPPEALLAAAREIDADAWFAEHRLPEPPQSRETALGRPFRAVSKLLTRRAPEVSRFDRLWAELADLEAEGDDWADAHEALTALEAENLPVFPDPVAYVTPRHGHSVAAGLFAGSEPWEAIAWLQHGTYALCAPRPVLAAHCRWLWQTYGARIITASTDHIGFELERRIVDPKAARDVLGRFLALGASEVNADRRGTDGATLVNVPRLWVWWD
jgi:hypothetical protein